MNSTSEKLLQNKKFLFFIIITLTVLLIVIFIFAFSKPQENVVIIDNLDKYTQIPTAQKDEVQKMLYSYVIRQNEINAVESKKTFHGIIRDNSPQTTTLNSNNIDVHSIDFILDIPELKYSYQTQFYWTKELSTSTDIDLGAVKIYCLPEDESIYPNFNCDKNPLVSIKTDPLLSIDMALSKDCWMSPFVSVESQSGYGIDIFYHPNDTDYTNNTIDSSYNKCVESAKKYLVSNGLELNNYKIRSEIKYFYNF